jgi:hypothetical protein
VPSTLIWVVILFLSFKQKELLPHLCAYLHAYVQMIQLENKGLEGCLIYASSRGTIVFLILIFFFLQQSY